MAKKTRKGSAAKAKKRKGTSASATAKTAARRAPTKPKAKAKAKTRAAAGRPPRRTARPKGIAGKVAGAYRTVVDTLSDTDALRKKMEPPGSAET